MIWHNVSDTLFLSSTYSLKNSEHIVTAVSDALGRVAKHMKTVRLGFKLKFLCKTIVIVIVFIVSVQLN